MITQESEWRELVNRAIQDLREGLAENTATTNAIKARVDRVADVIEGATAAFRAFQWIGNKVQWVAGIVVAIAAAWATVAQLWHHK